MGKRGNKKAARKAQKEKRFPASSPKTDSQEIIPTTETVVDGVAVVKDPKVCPHIDNGIDLEKVSSKMASLESLKCDDCREGVVNRRASKGKSKHGKKKDGGSKSQSKSIWVCLECGHFSCGGVGLPTTPQSHASRHAKQTRHPLAVQIVNPNLRWCFTCNTLIPIQNSAENGEQKDALSEVVKVLKGRSSPEASLDVEDVWFGSGSVTNSLNLANTTSSSSENRCGYMVRGLINLGNTCFFNSVLQNLLAMHKLRDYFLGLEGPLGPLTVSLKKLFIETSPSTGVRNVINPKSFFSCVCAKAPQFRGYQQHDSHELLRCLLEGLCTEESGARKNVLPSEEDNTVPNHAPAYVDTIFGGHISSTVSCMECGHASIVYEPYLDLSLPLPTKRSPSKRIQVVSRAKKPKVPPKRHGKFRTKTNRESDSSAAHSVPNIPTSDESSTPIGTESIEACAEQKIAPSCDSVQGDKDDSTVQKLVASQGNGIVKISESTSNESVILVDNLAQMDHVEPDTVSNIHEDKTNADSADFSSWLDYLEPTAVSNDHDTIRHLSDVSVTKMELVQNEELLRQVESVGLVEAPHLPDDLSRLDYLEPSTSNYHDMASNKEYPSVIQDSGNSNISWEDEPQLKVQESEILLLPYKEVTPTSGGNEFVSSSVSGEQDSSEFDGFGGLFNEPEIAAGPTVNSFSSGVEETRLAATNNSESDPDEVDNTDSPVSVEKCLAYFTTPELLTRAEHGWHCEQCSRTLIEQKMRLMNKHQKPVSNGCIEPFLPNGVRNINDGSTERSLLVNSDENLVLHNGKTYGSSVASELEEGKISANSQLPQDPCLVATSSEESCGAQDTDSSCVNKPKSRCKNVKVQQKESMTKLDKNEDEEVDSKGAKVARDASKRILINKAPPILTIHLKRFCQDACGRLSKLNGHVDFRDTIDLQPYMDPSCHKDIDRHKYQLVGVVEHQGTMRGGHYIAYVKGGSKWYYTSDANVREASLEEVLRCEAYILFYEQM